MQHIRRRTFLAQLSGAAAISFTGAFTGSHAQDRDYKDRASTETKSVCWLDVTAPLVIEDSALGIHSEIVLTADTFSGAKGYEDGGDSTDYEIYLYDANGKAIGEGGVAKRLNVPAMQTTVVSIADILGPGRDFFGGAKVRLRPSARTPMHASDLFSSAYLRLTSEPSFDNVHANPDPLQWHRPDSFFYSMPFPPLREYECLYSLFNPYSHVSRGTVVLYGQTGSQLKEIPYELKPHSSLILNLREGKFAKDIKQGFGLVGHKKLVDNKAEAGGTIAVTNVQGTFKNFGYLLIRKPERSRFSIEHPIHQSPFMNVAAKAPFDSEGRFKVKNILYTPLVFRSKKVGGLTLDTRFHFSSGAPIEENLWLRPFVTDQNGEVVWQPVGETRMPAGIAPSQLEKGAIKLGKFQSCIFDCAETTLPDDFSGALSLAIAPLSNHTLMKVEVNAAEWGAYAFTHFRPGLNAARNYQRPAQRGGLGTDYVTSAARLERRGSQLVRDELVCVMSIDDKGITGRPDLEVFSHKGLLARIKLGEVPPFGSRAVLLSELLPDKEWPFDLTLRLVDERSTLLMSIMHIDHLRRDIALDHGSDRFSTFQDFNCSPGD
jgi:hypothetical protein